MRASVPTIPSTRAPTRLAPRRPSRCSVIPRRAARVFRPNPPVMTVDLYQLPRAGQMPQLLPQCTPLLAAAQPKLAHQLLIPSPSVGQASNVRQQIAVIHAFDGTRPGHGYQLSDPEFQLLAASSRLQA